ncbi:hypothetical protein UFOVP46_9 [uncultured Caudovirales phage]|uniref:Uncharacterized protein n=1 Tax=uncultured Caudovirales phage TaxID=2100421 RepID=A0A6J5KMG5_9CAUD|nr:hypothetical protein UFOVP46_9 [uncultured Caudovirales phage]
MGLISPLATSNIGVAFESAYCKIDRIEADKNTISVRVTYYATQEARTENKSPIAGELYRIPTAEITGPLFSSVYTWLKANVDSLKSATDA